MISMDFFSLVVNSSMAGALIFFIVIISVYYLLSCGHIFKAPKLNKPPEVGGAWPVIGHLFLLRGPKLLHITLSEMADKYGPIFSIRFGLRPAIVVSNWELVKELSTTHDIAVASRPQTLASEHLGYDYAMFAFSPYGSYWRKIRKFVSLELLSIPRLNMLSHIRVSETKASIQRLYKLWADKGDDLMDGVVVEMKQWISDLTTNVIFRMIYGKLTYSGGHDDMEEAGKCQRIFKNFSFFFGVNVVGDMIPWLRWLDIGGHEKAMKEISKEYEDILMKWLEEHHDRRRGVPVKTENDFMDVMISMLKDANIDGYDADTINKSTCSILNIGGADSTGNMIIWTLCLMMNHSHVLNKVEEELDIHVGKERNVDESDLPKLVYLRAVIKEALRLYPPSPLGGPREVTRDCVVGGYHVAAGTRLIFNTWKLHRDPTIWPDPLEFHPERFLTTHSDIDIRGQNFEIIPFGAGRRVCPGINFAMQMGIFVLARLVQSFHLLIAENKPLDMSAIEGLTITKATPLELIVTPKLSSHLYAHAT